MRRIALALLAGLAGCYAAPADPPPAATTVPAPNPTIPPATTTPTPAPVTGCTLDATTAQPLLLVPTGATLVQVNTDGSQRVLYTFGANRQIDPINVAANVVQVKNGWVAAAAYLYDPNGSDLEEIVLIDPSGAVVWHSAYWNGANPSLYLAGDGTLAVDTWDGNGVVISPDGAEHAIQGYSPVAHIAGNGALPVRQGTFNGVHSFGWLALDTGTFTPISSAIDANDDLEEMAPAWIGDRLTYRSRAQGLALVSEVPGGALQLALPDAASPDGPQVVQSTDTGWALLRDVDGNAPLWVRANVDTGAVEALQLSTPNGFTAPTYTDLQLMDDGSIAASFEASDASTLFASTDLGSSWVAAGVAVPIVPETYRRLMTAQVRGGTTVVSSFDSGGYSFTTGPVQVLRPADGVAYTLTPALQFGQPPAGSATLRSDGLCAAFWTQATADSQGQLVALDVLSGKQTPLVTSDAWGATAYWLR